MTVFDQNSPNDIFSPLSNDQQSLNEAVEIAFKKKDFGTLFAGLDFLKFSPITAEKIVGVVGAVAGLVSTIGIVVGAFESMNKVRDLINGKEEFNVETELRAIGDKVN